MAELSTNLAVRGESLQTLYSQYVDDRLVVNRRYQRKLVWAVEEKRAFIDSLVKQLPVPLILVAERSEPGAGLRLEIIDGLQRLNAAFSFLENEYDVGGEYFDLNTLAETKLRLDSGQLIQRTPVMDRRVCATLASYVLAVSVYRAPSEEVVDEVFRRINSNGRYLSSQELRQAGCLSAFADVVREISAAIRGDYSLTTQVPLRGMPQISITNLQGGPGIFVDDIFWVRHRILDREQVRESRDEEIVADLLGTMLLETIPPYDSRVLDEFYGLKLGTEGRVDRINTAVARDGADAVRARFIGVLAALESILDEAGRNFSQLVFDSPKQRVPRYFEAVFLAFDALLHAEGREFVNRTGAAKALHGIGNRVIAIPSGGGTWTARSKQENANAVAGVLRPHTQPKRAGADPLTEQNPLMIENLLRASSTEISLLELKQGLFGLDVKPKFNEDCLIDILQTFTAMANNGPGSTGHVLIGIANKRADAERHELLSGKKATNVHSHWVTGIDHEASNFKTLDEYLLALTNKIRAAGLDMRLAGQILKDMRPVRFHGVTVLWLKVHAINEPVPFNNSFFERLGSQTVEVKAADLGRLFARFQRSNEAVD